MNRTDDETGGKEIIPGPDCAAGDRLEAQIRFLMEADREKEIVRQNYLASGNRRETDAEHAWHMALMVMLLSEYANEPIDRYRTMCLCLAHDLVEVYAGDTYAYDTNAQVHEDQEAREREAAERLFSLLPEDQAVWNAVGGTASMPQTIVLDRNGIVIYNKRGSVKKELLELLYQEASAH